MWPSRFDQKSRQVEHVEGQNTESRLVAFASTGEETTPAVRALAGRGAGGAEAGEVRVPPEPGSGRFCEPGSLGGCRETIPGGRRGALGWARFPHTRFLSQGKPAMRTPLRELQLQPGALTDSGKGPPMFSSLTPYLRKLELKVRFA